MDWITISLKWYFGLFILGLIFIPLTKRIFHSYFPDAGYAFSKTLGILLLSYAIFVMGVVKLLPFTRISLFILLALFMVINGFILSKVKQHKHSLFFIVFEEILFLVSFLFWVFVRGQEPSVRGLEKFMDFGFMSSILRSRYFPPLDMWYSADLVNPNGYPINYYYFGHLTGAVLIKLMNVKPAIGYNLILASIFALGVTQTFSLISGILFSYLQSVKKIVVDIYTNAKIIVLGLVGSFILNLGGNLHTIYAFTKGYPNESPIPFWTIMSWYNPTKYWYPNATRFIPNTIHEFPSYSYVVADLHGHVFDIPFVLLTFAILFLFFIKMKTSGVATENHTQHIPPVNKHSDNVFRLQISDYLDFKFKLPHHKNLAKFLSTNYSLLTTFFLGFLTAVHYMTNAFDGPIYILLMLILLLLLFKLTKNFLKHVGILILSFILFSLPFSIYFKPFVTGIGVNCSPNFLVKIQKFGPFLFEKGNCQISPPWMLLVLWGFFWVNFILFLIIKYFGNKNVTIKQWGNDAIDQFMLILFAFGTFLIIIPEFFYIKDIYPGHFRANTMFKLGYQAFMMMSISSLYVFFRIKLLPKKKVLLLAPIFLFFFFLVAIYPLFSIPSYYGKLDQPVEVDGLKWMEQYFPEDKEIIEFINKSIGGQPIILEAQGDSYTDFNRVSAYTGLPTVAGWWVHEWLWRGSADVVGVRIPDIETIYQSQDIKLTRELLKKYKVEYVIVSKMERDKYKTIQEAKFALVGKRVFTSSNRLGLVYKIN